MALFDRSHFKGTAPRDFRLQYPIGAVLNFFENSRSTTGVLDTGGKWKKSSIRKVLIIFLDTFG